MPVPLWAWRALHARWCARAEDGAAALGLDRSALRPRNLRHARLGRIMRRLGWVRLEDTGAGATRWRRWAWARDAQRITSRLAALDGASAQSAWDDRRGGAAAGPP